MRRPTPTWIYYFTHVDHLASIARDGLVCDADAHLPGRLTTEVGDAEIKARRRVRSVTTGPGGVLADYAPFYFGNRGPMLLNIHTGRVPSYHGGQAGLVYLCTTVERIHERGLRWVASDRNAATALARFTSDIDALDGHVDWPLVGSRSWAKTDADPDRPKRHQAELLVHGRLPWQDILFVAARHASDLARVEATLSSLDGYQPRRDVRPGWYF